MPFRQTHPMNATARKMPTGFRVGDTSLVRAIPIGLSTVKMKSTDWQRRSGDRLLDRGFRAGRPVFSSILPGIGESKCCVIGTCPPREAVTVPSYVQRRRP